METLAQQAAALGMNLIGLGKVIEVVDGAIEPPTVKPAARGLILKALERFHHLAEMTGLVPVHTRTGPDILHVA